jgi:hypothetical protein
VFNKIPDEIKKKMGATLEGPRIHMKVDPLGKYAEYLKEPRGSTKEPPVIVRELK